MFPLQEGVVGWDLRYINQPISLHHKLFILFLLVSLVWGIIFLLRCWRRIGIRSKWVIGTLKNILQSAQDGDWKEFQVETQSLSAKCPEHGLRAINLGKNGDVTNDLSDAVFVADAIFRYEIESLRVRIKGFYTLVTVIGLSCLLFLVLDIFDILWAVQNLRNVSARAIVGTAKETVDVLSWGLFFLIALFLEYRHLLSRIENRIINWEFFICQLRKKCGKRQP